MRAELHNLDVKNDDDRVRVGHDSKTLTLQKGSTIVRKDSTVEANLTVTSPFYFGGVPDDVNLPMGVTSHRFQGCFEAVQVKAKDKDGSSKTNNMKMTPEDNGDTPFTDGSVGYEYGCPIRALDCATFQGSGFVKLTQKLELSDSLDIYMSIYPTDESGVLLFAGDKVTLLVHTRIHVWHVIEVTCCICAGLQSLLHCVE